MAILLDSEQELENMETETSDELIPAVYAEREDLRVRLGEILEGLSEVQRQTITLYYYNELKVEEIAEIMECSTGTVKTRLFLARKAIRGEIEEQERKSGQRFYDVAGIPTLGLSQILTQRVEAASLPAAVSEAVLKSVSSAIAKEAAVAAQTAATAAGAATTAAKAGIPLLTKVIAGAVAAVVVAGAIAVPQIISKSPKSPDVLETEAPAPIEAKLEAPPEQEQASAPSEDSQDIQGGSYEGELIQGVRSGYGIWDYQNHHYEGRWANGLPNGEGKLTVTFDHVQLVYEGMFSDGLLSGAVINTATMAADGQVHEWEIVFEAGGVSEETTVICSICNSEPRVIYTDEIYGVAPWNARKNVDVSKE